MLGGPKQSRFWVGKSPVSDPHGRETGPPRGRQPLVPTEYEELPAGGPPHPHVDCTSAIEALLSHRLGDSLDDVRLLNQKLDERQLDRQARDRKLTDGIGHARRFNLVYPRIGLRRVGRCAPVRRVRVCVHAA